MSLLRAVVLIGLVVLCGGFIPVGGCAKGCGRAGRVASHEADDIARLGTRTGLRSGEQVAVGGAHYADDLARRGGHLGDDLAHTSSGFARELEQSGVKLSEGQHDELFDALQEVGEEVLGQLADGDPSDDEADFERTAVQLDTRLQATLTDDQLRAFHARFGTSKQVVERIAREAKK